MFTLSDYGSSVAMETAFWYQAVDDVTYPIDQLGKVTLQLERALRALANMALLVEYDVALFKDNLRRAAEIRLRYLNRIRSADRTDDHHYATGRYAHIVDAIAGEHFDIAREIHRQSPKQYHKGREYVDDYCFGALLGEWCQSSPDISRIDSLLLDFEQFLDGDGDPRFLLMRSFRSKDNREFEKGMNGLIETHESNIEAAKKKGVLLDAVEIALQRVSEEGICLLNLGKQKGFSIGTVFKYCPQIA